MTTTTTAARRSYYTVSHRYGRGVTTTVREPRGPSGERTERVVPAATLHRHPTLAAARAFAAGGSEYRTAADYRELLSDAGPRTRAWAQQEIRAARTDDARHGYGPHWIETDDPADGEVLAG